MPACAGKIGAFTAALWLGGCASTVTILQPEDRTTVAQITEFFEATIDSATVPNFAATVNGVVPPVPRDFKEMSSANGRTTFRATNDMHDFGPGIHRLTVTAPASPSRMFVPYSDTPDFIQAQFEVREHIVITGSVAVVSGRTTSGSTGSAAPAQGFFLSTSRPKTISIFSPVVATRPIEMELVPSANVSIASIPPAAPIPPAPHKVTIPVGSRGTLLTLTGVSTGPFSLAVKANGFRPSGLSGMVVP